MQRKADDPFVLQTSGETVVLEAKVRSTEVQERLFEFIRSHAAPGQAFENGIQVSPDAPDIPWLDRKPTFFKDLLSSINQSAIAIGSSIVVIRGQAPTKEVAEELGRQVAQQLSGYDIRNQITHPETPAVPLAEEPPNG